VGYGWGYGRVVVFLLSFFLLGCGVGGGGGGRVGVAMSACLVHSSDVGRLYYYNNKHHIGARKSGKRERGVLVRGG
jgi:hypothetical protein